MARAKKEPVGIPDDKPLVETQGAAFARLVASFKEQHPDTWETLRLCPLQHGLDVIAEALAD